MPCTRCGAALFLDEQPTQICGRCVRDDINRLNEIWQLGSLVETWTTLRDRVRRAQEAS